MVGMLDTALAGLQLSSRLLNNLHLQKHKDLPQGHKPEALRIKQIHQHLKPREL
jgi:hypothetical protein